MKSPLAAGKLLCSLSFALGATSLLVGDRLQLMAENKHLSMFPWQPGAIERCSWIAPTVVVGALSFSILFGILLSKRRQGDTRSTVGFRHWVAGLAGRAQPNRLSREKSPYLLQHQFNPVDWQAWGAAAYEQARREDKPIFLSVGYSTCH